MSILLYRKQYTHLKVLQLRYCGRDSIIQVRIDLIFIMVPLGEQKQMEEVQTYKASCRYVTYSTGLGRNLFRPKKAATGFNSLLSTLVQSFKFFFQL